MIDDDEHGAFEPPTADEIEQALDSIHYAQLVGDRLPPDHPESELVEAVLRSGRTLAYALLHLTTPGEIFATLRELPRDKVETLALALLAEYEEATSS